MIFPITPKISMYCVFLGNEVCSVFNSNNYFLGACPHLWDLNGGCVPFYCLLSLHWTCFSSLRPFPTGDSSLAPSSLLLRVEGQQAGEHAVSSFWTSGKGSDQGRPSPPWDLQGWLFGYLLSHSPPLVPEYFASALISLEIKFVSVFLNVNFLLQKIQCRVWINY